MLNNNITNEIWKPIQGTYNYSISNFGRVRNDKKAQLMNLHKINSGYLIVIIKSPKLVHRLVAKAFLEIPQVLETLEVNHIDCNKTNNHVSNLEWVTSSENKQHAISNGKYDKIFTLRNNLGKKHLPNNHSEYHNVTYDKNREKWVGCVRYEGKNYYHKRFLTELEAAVHVNWILDELGLDDRPRNII